MLVVNFVDRADIGWLRAEAACARVGSGLELAHPSQSRQQELQGDKRAAYILSLVDNTHPPRPVLDDTVVRDGLRSLEQNPTSVNGQVNESDGLVGLNRSVVDKSPL